MAESGIERIRRQGRERSRRYRATSPKAAKRVRPFVGVDGEGGNVGGRHLYLLLRAGEHVIESDEQLHYLDLLGFLSDLPDGVIYVSYYFDYDVTMILRDMPESRIRRLLNRDIRSVAQDGTKLWRAMPVDVGEFQIDYLPRKFFKVRRAGGKWTTISDISSFFQCSFVKALTDWEVTDSETLQRIQEGKDDRSNFGQLTEDTRVYNDLECQLLAKLAEQFRQVCVDVGYVPAEWQGPGYLAVSMFRKNGIPKTRDLPPMPTKVLEAANAAYYGGRFEVTSVGPVPGPVYQYDINSAYPDAIQRLPCLEHGVWEIDSALAAVHPTLVYGRFEPKVGGAFLYAFPIRDKDGGIYFPGQGKGWYWAHEIEAAIHQAFYPEISYTLIPRCACRPWDWIQDIYAERQLLGKAAKGKILKLGLNSLYGKTAQSIGGAPYANPIYASLITSLTRLKLATAIHSSPYCGLGQCGRDIHMVATDAVFSTTELPLEVGKGLGQWDLEVHDQMFVIQPGVYWTSDMTKPKTRGLPQRAVIANAQRFLDGFQDLANTGDTTPVPVPLTAFIGLRQAAHRNALDTAGTWVTLDKNMSFNWESKRSDETLPVVPGGPIRPFPIEGTPWTVSVPYSKEIGNYMDLLRIDFWEQPDFASDLFMGDDGL